MKDVEDLYYKNFTKDNIVYSLDMLRLKTYIDYNDWNDFIFWLETYFSKKIKHNWIGKSLREFHYNYSVELEEGKSFYIGFQHNNEKVTDFENKYNFTIEFNPNKLRDDNILLSILNRWGNWFIKSYDIAFDIPINILDLIYDMSGRGVEKIDNRGYDKKTIYIGTGDGRVKIYNKKEESNLAITGNMTRVEISRQIEDFPINRIKYFSYDKTFPNVYTNNYIYSLKDYEDKTMLAILYAVQNGFPLRNLTKTYRSKIKNLLEGGYKIKFDYKLVEQVIKQTMYAYFVRRESKQVIF